MSEELLAMIIQVIAWPLVVLIGILLFQKQIRTLLGNIEELELPFLKFKKKRRQEDSGIQWHKTGNLYWALEDIRQGR